MTTSLQKDHISKSFLSCPPIGNQTFRYMSLWNNYHSNHDNYQLVAEVVLSWHYANRTKNGVKTWVTPGFCEPLEEEYQTSDPVYWFTIGTLWLDWSKITSGYRLYIPQGHFSPQISDPYPIFTSCSTGTKATVSQWTVGSWTCTDL